MSRRTQTDHVTMDNHHRVGTITSSVHRGSPEQPQPQPWVSQMVQQQAHAAEANKFRGFRRSTNIEDDRTFNDPTGINEHPRERANEMTQQLNKKQYDDLKHQYWQDVGEHEKAGDYDNPLSDAAGGQKVQHILSVKRQDM